MVGLTTWHALNAATGLAVVTLTAGTVHAWESLAADGLVAALAGVFVPGLVCLLLWVSANVALGSPLNFRVTAYGGVGAFLFGPGILFLAGHQTGALLLLVEWALCLIAYVIHRGRQAIPPARR